MTVVFFSQLYEIQHRNLENSLGLVIGENLVLITYKYLKFGGLWAHKLGANGLSLFRLIIETLYAPDLDL